MITWFLRWRKRRERRELKAAFDKYMADLQDEEGEMLEECARLKAAGDRAQLEKALEAWSSLQSHMIFARSDFLKMLR